MRSYFCSAIYIQLLCLALVLQLFACKPLGDGFFDNGNTYGIPTQWIVNDDIYGWILDLDSCEKTAPTEGNNGSFYPLTCKPVQGAEIVLSASLLPYTSDEDIEFEYTTHTDAEGRFQFERRTTIRWVKNKNTNRYYGRLTITAEGNRRIYKNLSDSAIEHPYYFAVEDVKKPFVVFLNKYEDMTKR